MSGTRSPSKTAPATRPQAGLRLHLLLWPFATGTVAINLFLIGLIGLSVGLPALAPSTALWLSLPLGLPATWLVARWVASLMDEADRS